MCMEDTSAALCLFVFCLLATDDVIFVLASNGVIYVSNHPKCCL